MSLLDYTTKQLLDEVRRRAVKRRDAQSGSRGTFEAAVAREFALANTHLEDAQMRFTRGLAMENGVLNEVDLETDEGMARAEGNWRADHPGEESEPVVEEAS